MFSLLRASEFPISLQKKKIDKSLILTDGNFTVEHTGNYLKYSVLCPWMFKWVMRKTVWNSGYLLSTLKKTVTSKFFLLFVDKNSMSKLKMAEKQGISKT